jgi:flagellar hook protein FlgE
MLDSIYIGITGVTSHQTRMNVISNNVANVNTTAFKGGRANFSDVLSQTLSEGGPARAQISANPGAGVDPDHGDRDRSGDRRRRLFYRQRRQPAIFQSRRDVCL